MPIVKVNMIHNIFMPTDRQGKYSFTLKNRGRNPQQDNPIITLLGFVLRLAIHDRLI